MASAPMIESPLARRAMLAGSGAITELDEAETTANSKELPVEEKLTDRHSPVVEKETRVPPS